MKTLRLTKGEWRQPLIDLASEIVNTPGSGNHAAVMIYADTPPYGEPPSTPIAYICRDHSPDRLTMLADIMRAARNKFGMRLDFHDTETAKDLLIAYPSPASLEAWSALSTESAYSVAGVDKEAGMEGRTFFTIFLLAASGIAVSLIIAGLGIDSVASIVFFVSALVATYAVARGSMAK